MTDGSRRISRIRAKLPAGGGDIDPLAGNQRATVPRRRGKSLDHGLLKLMNVRVRKLMRVVTPLPAPKMLDLPQFQGEHKESLYWGTYRPHVYFGIRARTPQSLIAGLMWIGIKNDQYFLRHVCQDSDGLSTYGWIEHNGRDYGHQLLVDQDLSLTTSFLKERVNGSGYGGDWAIRLEAQNVKSISQEAKWSTAHLFFYMADEAENSLAFGREDFAYHDGFLLASGSREDVGGWQVQLKSKFTVKLPSVLDLAFVSGANSLSSRSKERINVLTGTLPCGQES
ncbi:Mannosyl-oligosaccharide glucosidase GCS1 [Platanthera guangdongensis]|uniref:Mannosyl-oligosaccharide glucosidase n=1 Tax=Platanthera guangdongensis TaxID=2320717 RepID=A0ABR2M6L4_9ASPA